MREYLQAIAPVFVLRRSCQSAAIDEVAKRLCESISNASKGGKTFSFIASNRCRIRKAPMDALRVEGNDGTAPVRVIANGDHIVEVLAVKFPNVLGAVPGRVDSEFRHPLRLSLQIVFG
jgi:hypothetical protein